MNEGTNTNLRRRQFNSGDKKDEVAEPAKAKSEKCGVASASQQNSYWLTRIILLRFIAFIYGVAFLVALFQNKALLGNKGLLPANKYLKNVESHSSGDIWKKLTYAPTIFWFLDVTGDNIDQMLDMAAIAGFILSVFVFVTGGANMIVMSLLWILYHSINSVGQRWYSFGWESQLLESGFLAIFLSPLLSLSALPSKTAPPMVVFWGYRWLIFRIMIGAGLIKIRGDQCWRDLTCMNYHYQTQPVPNPLSYYLHQAPETWHKIETAGNHFVELIAPWMMMAPIRKIRIIGGAIQVLFQVILISSGNLSFLNWLTILPCLACFDDSSLSWMFAKSTKQKLSSLPTITHSRGHYIRKVMEGSLAVLIAYLSIPVVQNLLSSRQAMNTSFDPLRLVNTYGAFGSITRERAEVIVQGTHANDPSDPGATWYEYEFKCKPGNVTRRPCTISPYHYRLDWLMWFSAFQSYQHNPWLVHLVAKLLRNDELVSGLIEYNPFEGKKPPKFIRLEHYLYQYTKIGSKAAQQGKWWTRRKRASYLPPVGLKDLQPYLKQMGWL